jgi:hypothetical protein
MPKGLSRGATIVIALSMLWTASLIVAVWTGAISVILRVIVERTWCPTEVNQQAPSPDGTYAALAEYTECLGATGNSSVTIYETKDQWRTSSGSVFSAPRPRPIALEWIDNRTLSVKYRYADVWGFKTQWRDVTVVHEQAPTDITPADCSTVSVTRASECPWPTATAR